MSNIAEGFERSSPAQFCSFLNIAKSSSAEVQSHLYACLDDGYIDQREFDSAYALARSANRLIGGLYRSTEARAKRMREAASA